MMRKRKRTLRLVAASLVPLCAGMLPAHGQEAAGGMGGTGGAPTAGGAGQAGTVQPGGSAGQPGATQPAGTSVPGSPTVPGATGASASTRSFLILPSISVTETLTDNARLSSTDKRSDAITQLSASLRAVSNTGRVRGSLDYALTGSVFARESDLNELNNYLAATGTGEVVTGHGFVDARALVTRQAISAFGTQSDPSRPGNTNQTETRAFSLSPYWLARLGTAAEMELRYSYQANRAKSTDIGNSNLRTALARISSTPGRVFGWSLSATQSISDYQLGRRTETDSIDGSFNWRPNPDLLAGVTAGVEQSDLLTLDKERHTNWGLLFRWTPSPRTIFDASYQHHFYGQTHTVSLQQRFAHTSWTISDTRSLSTSNGQVQVRLGTAYDLFFQQFASIQPDPVQRDALVRSFLASNGINPNGNVTGGFLASEVTMQHVQTAAFALTGVRNTLTVQASRSDNRRADAIAVVSDDLSRSGRIRQNTVSTNLAHRLTPVASLNIALGWQRSLGDLDSQSSTLKTLVGTWSTQLSRVSRAAVTLRRSNFSSPTSPYQENALIATYSRQF